MSKTIKQLKDELLGNYIKPSDCEHGFLYFIDGRNANFGIWNSFNEAFDTHRQKFGDNFLGQETHWDLDHHYGTVKPLIKLNKVDDITDNEMLDLLYSLEIKYSDSSALLNLLKTKQL